MRPLPRRCSGGQRLHVADVPCRFSEGVATKSVFAAWVRVADQRPVNAAQCFVGGWLVLLQCIWCELVEKIPDQFFVPIFVFCVVAPRRRKYMTEFKTHLKRQLLEPPQFSTQFCSVRRCYLHEGTEGPFNASPHALTQPINPPQSPFLCLTTQD